MVLRLLAGTLKSIAIGSLRNRTSYMNRNGARPVAIFASSMKQRTCSCIMIVLPGYRTREKASARAPSAGSPLESAMPQAAASDGAAEGDLAIGTVQAPVALNARERIALQSNDEAPRRSLERCRRLMQRSELHQQLFAGLRRPCLSSSSRGIVARGALCSWWRRVLPVNTHRISRVSLATSASQGS